MELARLYGSSGKFRVVLVISSAGQNPTHTKRRTVEPFSNAPALAIRARDLRMVELKLRDASETLFLS